MLFLAHELRTSKYHGCIKDTHNESFFMSIVGWREILGACQRGKPTVLSEHAPTFRVFPTTDGELNSAKMYVLTWYQEYVLHFVTRRVHGRRKSIDHNRNSRESGDDGVQKAGVVDRSHTIWRTFVVFFYRRQIARYFVPAGIHGAFEFGARKTRVQILQHLTPRVIYISRPCRPFKFWQWSRRVWCRCV